MTNKMCKSCCRWSLRTGAGLTVLLTTIWTLCVLGIAVHLFTHSFGDAKSLRNDYSHSYNKRQERESEIIVHHLLSWVYFGLVILGGIAVVLLLAAVIQQVTFPIIFWFLSLTIGLCIHLIFSIIHLATSSELDFGIKIAGVVFTVTFIYPWIITYSYYDDLRNHNPRTGHAGIVLQPPPQPHHIPYYMS